MLEPQGRRQPTFSSVPTHLWRKYEEEDDRDDILLVRSRGRNVAIASSSSCASFSHLLLPSSLIRPRIFYPHVHITFIYIYSLVPKPKDSYRCLINRSSLYKLAHTDIRSGFDLFLFPLSSLATFYFASFFFFNSRQYRRRHLLRLLLPRGSHCNWKSQFPLSANKFSRFYRTAGKTLQFLR